MLFDADKLGAGAVPIDGIEAALDSGDPVIVEEPDGSESLLVRGEDGKFKTSPKPPQ